MTLMALRLWFPRETAFVRTVHADYSNAQIPAHTSQRDQDLASPLHSREDVIRAFKGFDLLRQNLAHLLIYNPTHIKAALVPRQLPALS